jgi:repressor LexA
MSRKMFPLLRWTHVVEGLDGRKIDILRYVARRESRGETPPSIREIGAAVGLKSTRSAHAHVVRLEGEGYVERRGAPRGKVRLPRLTEKGWRAVGTAPVMGRVAAGRGLEAVVDGEPYSLSQLLEAPDGGRRYLLRSVGQSMRGAGIEDGDLLVVEEDENPPDGTVVVALLDGGDEVTVKRLYREGEMIRLRPQNGDHEDIVVSGDDVRVQGRVEYVFHPPRR